MSEVFMKTKEEKVKYKGVEYIIKEGSFFHPWRVEVLSGEYKPCSSADLNGTKAHVKKTMRRWIDAVCRFKKCT
jgi:hypothetical protein